MLPPHASWSWVAEVPDHNPFAKSFRFPAMFDGVRVEATAVARHDQIELYPVPGKFCIEISIDEFRELAAKLLVAAHTRRPS